MTKFNGALSLSRNMHETGYLFMLDFAVPGSMGPQYAFNGTEQDFKNLNKEAQSLMTEFETKLIKLAKKHKLKAQ